MQPFQLLEKQVQCHTTFRTPPPTVGPPNALPQPSNLNMSLPRHHQLNEIEGWVYLRTRYLSKRRRQYLRLNGSVVTIHHEQKSPIDSDLSLLDSSHTFFPRRAFIILTLSSGSKLYLQPQLRHTCEQWAQALRNGATRNFYKYYQLAEKIGEGAFASVHKATRLSDNAIVAVKKIKKRQFDMRMARELDREMYIMKNISHPALISAHEVFNTSTTVFIVMDFMEGGTLKENIQRSGAKVSEHAALPIMRQVLDACAYLHSLGYVHRDLKLENVLCESHAIQGASVRLADFGYANFINHATDYCLRSLVGTPVYVAPEIINRQPYGAPVDLYAVGVMLHRMLVGYYPFEAKDDEKTLALALKGKLRLDGKAWQDISPLCKSFIHDLLRPQPELRLTAADALQHPWLQIAHQESVPEKRTLPTTSVGSESPAMMSPVTPDWSLPRSQTHVQCRSQNVGPKFPVEASDCRQRANGITNLAAVKLFSSHTSSLADSGVKTLHGLPEERVKQLRALLKASLTAVLFVAKLRFSTGTIRTPDEGSPQTGMQLRKKDISKGSKLPTRLPSKLQKTFLRFSSIGSR